MENSGKIAIILILTAAAYSNIFFNQKAVDDKIFIGAYHPSVAEAFAGVVPKGHEGVYRPVRGLLYLVYFQLFGANPFFYHLHSILVHLISTGLVYLIIREIGVIGGIRGDKGGEKIGWIGGLLFGLHPIHTESITYIAASMEMTGVMFMLGSFYLYITIFKQFQITHILSLFLALLAFFTYEMTLTLPLLILWYEWTLNRGNFKFQISNLAVYFWGLELTLLSGFLLWTSAAGGRIWQTAFI